MRRPSDSLRASSPGHSALRAGEHVEDGTAITGYLSVFGQEHGYEINSSFEGHFIETVERGAFARTLRDQRDGNGGWKIRMLLNHGASGDDLPVGVFTDLREDDHGLRFEGRMFDSSPHVQAMLPGLRAGQYGCSIRFRAVREDYDPHPAATDWNPDALPVRRLREIRLFEAGPVVFPASPSTSATVRSLADEEAFARICQLPAERVEELARYYRAAREMPTPREPIDVSPQARRRLLEKAAT